jgi:hypothetical protein
VQFTLYLGFLVWPMIALGWVINIFQRAWLQWAVWIT